MRGGGRGKRLIGLMPSFAATVAAPLPSVMWQDMRRLLVRLPDLRRPLRRRTTICAARGVCSRPRCLLCCCPSPHGGGLCGFLDSGTVLQADQLGSGRPRPEAKHRLAHWRTHRFRLRRCSPDAKGPSHCQVVTRSWGKLMHLDETIEASDCRARRADVTKRSKSFEGHAA